MGVKTHLSVNLSQSVSISGAEINLTLRAVTTYLPRCNFASIIPVVQPRPNIRSQSVLLLEIHQEDNWAGTDPHRFPPFYRNRSDFS